MPQNQHKRAWLLLAASITLHVFILNSTRIVRHAVDAAPHEHLHGTGVQNLQVLLKKRSGDIVDGVSTSSIFSLPYTEYYQSTPPTLQPFYLVFLILILAFLFSFIGISASDFFCPNLSTIATYLGLNESTAGVTFLAFGNGSPDVFSTFAAMRGGTFGLAIGELLGAASFIVSIVVGSIALIRPFHVPRSAFLRDVIFFTSAVIVLIAVLHDGHLTLYESGGMVLLYIAYVAVVVGGNWLSRRRRRKAERESLLRRSPSSPFFYSNHNGSGSSTTRAASSRRRSSENQYHQSPQDILAPPDGHGQNVLASSPDTLHPIKSSPLSRRRSNTTTSHLHTFAPHLHHQESINTPRANFSLLGAVEFRDVVNSLRAESQSASASRSPSLRGTPLVGPGVGGDYFGPVSTSVLRGHRRSSSQASASRDDQTSAARHHAQNHSYRGRRRASSHAVHLTPRQEQSRSVSDSATTSLPAVTVSEPNPWSDQAGRPATPTPTTFADDSLPSKPGRPRIVIPEVARTDVSPTVPIISVVDPSGVTGALAESPPLQLQSPGSLQTNPKSRQESRFAVRRRSKIILRVLFPSLQSFRHKSALGMVLAITAVPAVLALTLTLPVVDDGRECDEGGVELPIGENEGLNEEGLDGFTLDANEENDDDHLDVNVEEEADRLLTPEIGEELHHLVDHGFSPFHSPLGRIRHSALRRASQHVESGINVDGGEEDDDDDILTLRHVPNSNRSNGVQDGDDGEGNKETMYEEEEGEEGLGFNKYLTAAQCVLGPVFCSYIIFGEMSYLPWVLLGCFLAGTIAATAVLYLASDGTAHPWKLIRCFCGFICSMVWIAAIADQVVDVLNTVGEILGLSDAIIGLTIFAVGNSLADLVANVTVAQFAPAMAYAACFGGPMLNLLLGVGGSGTYHMLTSPSSTPVTVNFSPTLWVSAAGLVAVLITTAIFVPLNGYLIDRRWACCLIVAYVVLMGVNVGVELKTGRA